VSQPLLLPPVYDIAFSAVVLAQLALLLAALVQWFRARSTGEAGALELVAIVLVPVLGPVAYLLARRGAARRRGGGTGGDSTGALGTGALGSGAGSTGTPRRGSTGTPAT
jgi:hypothetical protein